MFNPARVDRYLMVGCEVPCGVRWSMPSRAPVPMELAVSAYHSGAAAFLSLGGPGSHHSLTLQHQPAMASTSGLITERPTFQARSQRHAHLTG